ncbi:hypothetical protein M433DRAFT_235113 [Acidomyces richmondensis BFW]|nr:MAG: hypothetical protein FE78DRAFT_166867 [Acidomyces sp. 'richmondensis']KYG45878.1 hypothetical protein M433DRAFT_235113 [Acidomyces richmondensis BFW]
MPPAIQASVSYKKKDGHLAISADKKYVFWTPIQPPSSPPAVTIVIADITNLQQTPESSAKVALKVFVKEESHVFSFTSKEGARREQENVTNLLRDIIAANKAAAAEQLLSAATSTLTPAQNGGEAGHSAAMAIAKAISSQREDEAWLDDSKLIMDFQLQRSLLTSNKPLNDRFTQALREKPESVTVPQFTAQFWSTRIHLLRAHFVEKAQKEGEYNVLPEIKYKTVIGQDGEPTKMLNVTSQQIKLIFKQYPVVRQAYNETVPTSLNENTFWQRFFQSRLLKKLKGDRIDRTDPQDAVLDKYLDYNESGGTASIQHIPHFIDLEGNEQNTKYKVNREGWEMRADRHDEPIFHTLNNMSIKLLSHVAPEDGEAHGPIGMDENTFERLRLRDLAMNDADNRILLNVREPARHEPGETEDLSADAKLYAKQDPQQVISDLQFDLKPNHPGNDENDMLRLDRVVCFDSDEDDDEDEDMDGTMPLSNGGTTNHVKKSSTVPIGSKKALKAATLSILKSIKQRRLHSTGDSNSFGGLSKSSYDTIIITHNTTTEFLHYFWTLFHSGDASKASELVGLVSTLDKSIDRINAVAEQAESERQAKLERMRKQVNDYFERTGKRRKVDENLAGGGRKAIEEIMRPTIAALKEASETYRKALQEQTAVQSTVA